MLDILLEIISGAMLVFATYGIGILDDDANLGLLLILGCILWFGLLTLIANWPHRRRSHEKT